MNERIEWTRVWREEADRETKRVLLVGDSIIDGSKGMIQKYLPEGYAITSFATSKGVDDPFFIKEIELVCAQENYYYQAVYFNSGLHFHEQTPEAYGSNYRNALEKLRGFLPDTPVVLGLSTPLTDGVADPSKHETPITLRDTNETVLAYNEQVKALAAELSLPVFDAYGLMVPHPELKIFDGVHFSKEGNTLLGKAIAEAIETLLK
ncbi:MAG: SGNH/GDSL hydrolase family protein [Clostridia bacterium]|nr:SGNH/GDSL hydrolase family protein [Clostridia bacterium]